MFGVPYAVAVNSATSGLHCALVAVGVGPGDYVLVQGVTMSASASAVVHAGATPVFVDVSPRSGLPTTQDWRDAYELCQNLYERKPKAAVVVHLHGQVVDIGGMGSELRVVEDCAQSPGCTSPDGYFAGTMGDVGVFSFNQDKVMTSGEGGCCVTRLYDYAETMKLMRNHGENESPSVCGYNYRMTELTAAVARSELMHLPHRQEDRMKYAVKLALALEESDRFVPMDLENPPYYFYATDTQKSKKAPMPEWRRGYSRPLCCTPYFKHHFKQSCLVGAHTFDANLLLTRCPESEEEVAKKAEALLKWRED